jgi:4-amino-4-deoxy-L-arabinose transferase-like glycosyltransferase
MSSLPQTETHTRQPRPPAPAQAAPGATRARSRALPPLARHIGLPFVLGLSALLNTRNLSQNGYANIFYSAGVKSMLGSLHDFLFASFDPGGFITVDKPPLALWVQVASAKVFGFSPLSLLLPQAILGVLSVLALYLLLTRRLGAAAAFAGALALAVYPSFVAVSRENGVDPLLIFLLVLACAAGVRAAETGRWRSLILTAILIGLAFNTKTLAAYLAVPGIALGFLVCAPDRVQVRVLKLLVAGVVMGAVSFSWITFVELTPKSQRPFVGSSRNDTELQLTFGYNGLGRVEGQEGGPNQVFARPGARVEPPAPKPSPSAPSSTGTGKPGPPPAIVAGHPAKHLSTFLPDGRYRNPIPFGSAPSPVRLFGKGLGDQDGWELPLALFGLIALAVMLAVERRRRHSRARPQRRAGRRDPESSLHSATEPAERDLGTDTGQAQRAPRPWRRDPRLATLLVLGGWFAVEATVLSLSKGIVHPYYVSALGPGTGAMAGAGALALVALRRGRRPGWGIGLFACAVIGTVAVQVLLLHREHYMLWFVPVLVAGGAVAIIAAALVRRLAAPVTAAAFLLLMIAPTAYSATTWYFPVEGTFPAAGPKTNAGLGGYGISKFAEAENHAAERYILSHHPGHRWVLLTVSADTAAPFVLNGLDVAPLGGYSGTDPALTGPGLARLIRRGEARFVMLGGAYSTRGGNGATQAVLRVCRLLDGRVWHDPDPYIGGLSLFDCAGRARQLAEPAPRRIPST